VVLWLDNWLHGDGRAPFILVAGAWLAATATVALAEEAASVAESGRLVTLWRAPIRNSLSCQQSLEDDAGPGRRVPVTGRGAYAVRALPDLCLGIRSERLGHLDP
jgi:hypothetical protein